MEITLALAIFAAAVVLGRATYGIWQIASDYDACREVK